MKTYLITGGAGNVGGTLALHLAKDKSNIIIIVDNLSTGSLHKVPKLNNVHFIKSDVNLYNDIAPIFARYNFDYVFHYAALVGVKRTLENPMRVLNDIEGIKNSDVIFAVLDNLDSGTLVESGLSMAYDKKIIGYHRTCDENHLLMLKPGNFTTNSNLTTALYQTIWSL